MATFEIIKHIDNNDQHVCNDQQSQKSSLEKDSERDQQKDQQNDQQRVSIKTKCCNALKSRIDLVNLVRNRDKSVKQSNVKINKKKVNNMLKFQDIPFIAGLIHDIVLFIYFLTTFILSIVRFAVNQDSFSYNIVCIIISFNGLVVERSTLIHTFYEWYSKKKNKEPSKVKPQLVESKTMAWEVKDIESLTAENLEDANTTTIDDKEELEIFIIKKIIKDVIKYIFIVHPAVICSLYGIVNKKSWQFDDALAGIDFIIFLYTYCVDALHKLKFIWRMQRAIISLYYESYDNWKTKFKECWIPSILFTPYIIFFTIAHWLMLAIIGVRIYVDNFSTEIDQGGMSETGGYKVPSYTRYMIFCGVYLPVASVVVFIVLNRAWFSDEVGTVQKIFYFLGDPLSYLIVIFLMVPFIAFCVGIYLPDYDSSEFEVDADARGAADNLGVTFIVIFLFCNLQATVLFAIITIVIGIISLLIISVVLKCVFDCITCNVTQTEHKDKDKDTDESDSLRNF